MDRLYILTGEDKGRSFELKKRPIYVGRSSKNDVRIKDKGVSRRHLRIVPREGRYFIEDLQSTNGTFVDGAQINPGTGFEVKKGVPIVMGMSVICLGEKCLEDVMPFLDSMGAPKERIEDGGMLLPDRPLAALRNLELLYKISAVLRQSLDINDVMERVLGLILELLKRIDRGVIVLIDHETGETKEIVSRFRSTNGGRAKDYSRELVDRVILEGEAIVIPDVHVEEGHGIADTLRLWRIGSVLCVPLIGNSQIMGVIYVESHGKPYGFRKQDLSLLTAIGTSTALAVENALLHASLPGGSENGSEKAQSPNS